MRPRAFPERTLVMSKKITIMAGSKRMKEPRLVGSIIEEMLQGWNRNTDLAVDLSTAQTLCKDFGVEFVSR